MKKILVYLSLTVGLIVFAMSVQAQENHGGSLDDVLGEITQSQKVSSIDDIDRSGITDEQFEKLGDAVMGAMVPSEQQHELMDGMMGGEGSESLRATHIMMGQRYLGSSDGAFPMGGMGGMMGAGGGMMGCDATLSNFSSGRGGGGFMNSMMSNGGSMGFGLGWIATLLFWALIIFGIIMLVRHFTGNKSVQNKNNSMTEEKTPLEILRQRYAKGEIKKDEYDKMKEDLDYPQQNK